MEWCKWVVNRVNMPTGTHYPLAPTTSPLSIPYHPPLLTQEKIPWEGEFTIRSDP